MGFTSDQNFLNNVNIDSIREWQEFNSILQPLLFEESGYRKTTSNSNVTDFNSLKLGAEQRQRLEADIDIYRRLKEGQFDQVDSNGNAFFKDKYGRNIVKEGDNVYYNDPGSNFKRYSISSQMNAAEKNIQSVVDQSLDKLKFDPATGQLIQTTNSLEKTSERLAMEERLKKFQEAEMKALEEEAAYRASDEYKAGQERQRAIEKQQQEQALAFGERQKRALEGNIERSPVVAKAIQDNLEKFKEAQAREGRIVMGDSVEELVGKGSAAQEAVSLFKDEINALKQRELEAYVNQTPLYLTGVELSSGLTQARNNPYNPGTFTGMSSAFNRALPTTPNYGGISQLSMASHQPYQFNQQMQFNYAQLNAANANARRARQSALLGAGLGAAGSVFGGYLAGA